MFNLFNRGRAKNKIYISDDNEPSVLSKNMCAIIKEAIDSTLEYEDFSRMTEISVTVTTDTIIHEMNRESRGVDRPTDVLSFPVFDEDFGVGRAILGDIVISYDTAVRQASEYGHSIDREIAFLTVHSMLHLLGYDHETSDEDERDMFARQETILKMMGLSRKKEAAKQ